MIKNIFVLILVFVLLFVAFNPSYLDPTLEPQLPTFSEIFLFGYELTVGSVEVVTSIFKGPDAFLERFSSWRSNVFGEFTVLDFLDSFTDRIPVVRTLKRFAENVIAPLDDVFTDLSDWIRRKLD